MRAHRGFTGIAAVALAVVLVQAPATADERDDGPVAAVVPGRSVGYFDPSSPDSITFVAEWTHHSGPLATVPHDSTSLRIVFPDEMTDVDHVIPTALVFTGFRGDVPTAGAVTVDPTRPAALERVVDLPVVVAALEADGLGPVDRIRTSISTAGDADPSTTITVVALDILLDASPAAGEGVAVLGTRGYVQYAYTTTPVRAVPGTRIGLAGSPGYWTDGVTSWFERSGAGGLDAQASADGSTLWFTTLPRVEEYEFIEYQLYRGPGSYITETVRAPLLPPSTDAVAAYVTSVYNDLFDRDPDPGGLVTWTNALKTGTPYSAVADAITSSAEFRSGLIRDAYAFYLGRAPDPAGLAFWLEQMRRGMHIQQMEAGFLASAEYYGYAGGTDAGWVRWLYLDVLGREPAPSEVSFWVPIVRSHGRGEVAKGFLYSTERLTFDVDGYYQWLLHRHLDPAGRTSWVRAIQAGTRVEAIIAGIISSAEYRNNVPVG